MDVITIESEAYQNGMDKLSEIEKLLKNSKNCSPLSETWLDVSDVCMLLKISKRLLQSYRDNGILSYSQVKGKIYFRSTDISELLDSHYVDSKRKR